MSEEQVEAKENVAEELTEWSEVDLSPTSEQEKIEFEVEGAEPEVESKPEVEKRLLNQQQQQRHPKNFLSWKV